MNLARMTFHGYRSLRDVDLRLGPFTVFVGPNNAGKSNIVDAISFYRDILFDLDRGISERGGFQHLVFRGVNGPAERITVGVEALVPLSDVQSRVSNNGSQQPPTSSDQLVTGFQIRHTIAVSSDPANPLSGFVVPEEELQIHAVIERDEPRAILSIRRRHHDVSFSSPLLARKGGSPWLDMVLERPFQNAAALERLNLRGHPSPVSLLAHVKLFSPIVDVFATSVSTSRVYRFDPSAGRGPGIPSVIGDISPRGSHLPALAAFLQAQYPLAWEKTLQWVRLVAPNVENVAVRADHDRLLRLEFSEAGHSVPWTNNEVSDGTLRSLMLFAALFDPRWGLQVFEEPESSLHPWAIRSFVDACREVMAEQPRQQIALTTHSQALIDYVAPEEITIVWRQDGGTEVRALTELEPTARAYWAEGRGKLSNLLDSGLLLETVPVSSG